MLASVAERTRESGAAIAYLNVVGGQDALVFDGASFVLNATRTLAHQLPDWDETIRLTEWVRGESGWTCATGAACRSS